MGATMQKSLRRCGRYAVVYTFGFFSGSILWQRACESSAVPSAGLIPLTGTSSPDKVISRGSRDFQARDTAVFQAGSQETTTYDSRSPHLTAAQAERNATHIQTEEAGTDLTTDPSANGTLYVASGAVAKSPFLVPQNEPPRDQYAPVFISEELLNRTDFAIKLLKKFTGGWTVDDPAQAVFYIVCCGPLERFLQLPARSPERPYLCYDCDAVLRLERLSITKPEHPDISGIWTLLSRRDFMFSSTDLRYWNIMNDSALLLPGVTHAHHKPKVEELDQRRIQPHDPPMNFLTFQGLWNCGQGGSSFVRLNMAVMLNSTTRLPKAMKTASGEPLPLPQKNYTPPSDVFISISGELHNFKVRRHYYALFDSAYSLVTRLPILCLLLSFVFVDFANLKRRNSQPLYTPRCKA
ncbi:Ext1 [Symbiodinium sp. CCMP2592]|nr:Ext1 [Symbiodinium sp. CCMP2592]